MAKILLTLNVGSSSLKFSLFTINKNMLNSLPLCWGQIENLTTQPKFTAKDKMGNLLLEQKNLSLPKNNFIKRALRIIFKWVDDYLPATSNIVAVGHRVVHGGEHFYQPVTLNEKVLQILSSFNSLAPQHQPHNIAGIRFAQNYYPNALHVACFDTAFHRTQSEIAQAFALPDNITKQPIRRYGFHGLSYEYIANSMKKHIGKITPWEKTIVAHLGHGASLCAMLNRQSVATTMGFTALDGLMMAKRCGNLDPGVILYLLQQEKISPASVQKLLYEESGLLGVSEISEDIRVLLQSKHPKAKKAIDLYVYRIVKEMGGLIGILHGLDHLIFTAGIGEHLAEIRLNVCKSLKWLGLKIDKRSNIKNATRISSFESKISVWVIPTNEEKIIAKHTWKIWQNRLKEFCHHLL